MSNDPVPPSSDEANPDDQTTPAGQVGELEEMIGETDADTAPDGD